MKKEQGFSRWRDQEHLLTDNGAGGAGRLGEDAYTGQRGWTMLASAWQILFEHLLWAKERATEQRNPGSCHHGLPSSREPKDRQVNH